MSYAIRKDGQGWRAVNGIEDIGPDENFAEEKPTPGQPDAKQTIRNHIYAMEQQQLLPRATREFMLLYMETQFAAEMLAANPGYQAVKAFDNEIKALRAQL